MKKSKIINYIKKSKEIPVDANWLSSGQKTLQSFISGNPVRNDNLDRRSMQEGVLKKLIFKPMPIAIFVIIASLITGGGVVAASQDSLPTGTLYSVKIIAEKVEEIATFNDVKKIELQTKFAGKRLEEIKELQEQGGATKMIVEKNLQEYQNNLTKAQGYLVEVNEKSDIISPKILSASINLEKAIDEQQVVMGIIEERALPEYKTILTENKEEALNSFSQSLKKVRVRVSKTEQFEEIFDNKSNELEIGGNNVILSTDKDNTIHGDTVNETDDKLHGFDRIAPSISEEDAIKIATDAGLAKGIEKWETNLYWYERAQDYVWTITNRTSYSYGQTVVINATSGKVFEILDRYILDHPSQPLEKQIIDKPIVIEKPIPVEKSIIPMNQ